jgi:hypothetical protein
MLRWIDVTGELNSCVLLPQATTPRRQGHPGPEQEKKNIDDDLGHIKPTNARLQSYIFF